LKTLAAHVGLRLCTCWRNLVAVLRRLLAGERGPQLTAGLDRTDTAIVQKILAQL
jgi:hypothetical protein